MMGHEHPSRYRNPYFPYEPLILPTRVWPGLQQDRIASIYHDGIIFWLFIRNYRDSSANDVAHRRRLVAQAAIRRTVSGAAW